MRKVSILLLSFISALIVWGQSESHFDIKSTKDLVENLRQQQSDIVEQAKTANISEVDKENADWILTKAFESLDNVLGVYNEIKETPSLVLEAQNIIGEFLKDYDKAISSNDGQSIQISTRNFLDVALSYWAKSDSFYQKAQEHIAQNLGSNVGDKDEKKENDNDLTKGENNTYSIEETSTISVWDCIAIGLGIIGLIVGGYAVICVNAVNKRTATISSEIAESEIRLMQRIKEIKPSSYRGPAASSYMPQSKSTSKPQVKRKEPVDVSHPRNEDPKPEQANIEQEPTASNLYATINTGSSLAEFYKVTTSNSRDKVFMLILPNPEAEIADYTIVPDMPSDFMKSVIADRDTYLPAIFCEKSIDSQNPSKIEVLSKGRARKVDGKWQVQERMSIRLV